jgi:hypothetical protein
MKVQSLIATRQDRTDAKRASADRKQTKEHSEHYESTISITIAGLVRRPIRAAWCGNARGADRRRPRTPALRRPVQGHVMKRPTTEAEWERWVKGEDRMKHPVREQDWELWLRYKRRQDQAKTQTEDKSEL